MFKLINILHMNEKNLELKVRFKDYLNQKWENVKNLDETIKRFWNSIFDVFFDWLEDYRKNPRNYRQVFYNIVLPQLKFKAEKNFWDIYFKRDSYEKYELLFVNFMVFVKKNNNFINSIMFDKRRENIENLVEWKYWTNFDKKKFIKAWHNYIMEDKWKNWDKLREYLADIYWYLNFWLLNNLYDIFFNSYELCSEINSKNNKNKWNKNYKKRDSFYESFSNLKNKISYYDWEKISEIKSLFWKYLNFIPKYRNIIFKTINNSLDWWKVTQKNTEINLIDNLSESNKNKWIEWDWFWPIEIIETSRDENLWYYDHIARWDIIAPIDYWIYPDIQKPKKNKKKKNNGQTEINF